MEARTSDLSFLAYSATALAACQFADLVVRLDLPGLGIIVVQLDCLHGTGQGDDGPSHAPLNPPGGEQAGEHGRDRHCGAGEEAGQEQVQRAFGAGEHDNAADLRSGVEDRRCDPEGPAREGGQGACLPVRADLHVPEQARPGTGFDQQAAGWVLDARVEYATHVGDGLQRPERPGLVSGRGRFGRHRTDGDRRGVQHVRLQLRPAPAVSPRRGARHQSDRYADGDEHEPVQHAAEGAASPSRRDLRRQLGLEAHRRPWREEAGAFSAEVEAGSAAGKRSRH